MKITLLALALACGWNVGDSVTVDNIYDDDSDHTATVVEVKEGATGCKVKLDDGLMFFVAEDDTEVTIGKWKVTLD